MNTADPIYTKKKTIQLPDKTMLEITGMTFAEQIFKIGEPMHSLVGIKRMDNGKGWGCGFYREVMSEEELTDKVNEIADNPTVIKF
jgi:hypothetical protein